MRKIICTILVLVMVLTLVPVGPNVQAANASPNKKLVAITFDDGPGRYTDYLVKELNKLGAKATFFMLGQCAQEYPDTVRNVYLSGHEIGCHTWDHPELTSLSNDQIQSQFRRTYNVLDKACGKGTKYLTRAPYDSTNPRVRNLIDTPFIVWSVDPQDWDVLNREKVKSRIVSNTEPGDIILVHDIYKTSVDGALDAIKILKSQGYEFVTVSELFRRRNISMKNHEEYYSCHKNADVDLGPIKEPTISYNYKDGKLWVTIKAQKGASIYYNTDGSGIINAKGNKYNGPFPVKDGTTVYAISAFNLNGGRSKVVKKAIKMYSDVKPGDWFADEIDRAVKSGFLSGYGNGIYKPRENIARKEFAAMLYRMAGSPKLPGNAGAHHYKDVPSGSYYEKAVQWGYANKLIYGYDDEIFGSVDMITREQVCAILYRYLVYSGKQLPVGKGDILKYSDQDQVQKYTRDAVDAMLNAGLLKGTTDGRLRPRDPISRAEAAAMLIRVLDYIK